MCIRDSRRSIADYGHLIGSAQFVICAQVIEHAKPEPRGTLRHDELLECAAARSAGAHEKHLVEPRAHGAAVTSGARTVIKSARNGAGGGDGGKDSDQAV